MLNGIIILQDGTFQQIGSIVTARAIIATMRKLIIDLEEAEREALLKEIPRDVLESYLAEAGKK